MEDYQGNPPRPRAREEILKDRSEFLIASMDELAVTLDLEIDEGRKEKYLQLLINESKQAIAYAFKQAAMKTPYFPKPAELKGWCDEFYRSPANVAAGQAADQILADQYKQRLLAAKNIPALPSGASEEQVPVTALTSRREFQNPKGFPEPKQQSVAEYNDRMEVLRQQRERLNAKS